MLPTMRDVLNLICWALIGLLRSRVSLDAEITALRHQLNILQRQSRKRPTFSVLDRLIFVILFRIAPGMTDVLKIVEPETVVRWHRSGFRQFWRWKSRSRRGRPKVPSDTRQLIREMSLANPLWGAPRIHGELLKLGIDVGQTSVAKYGETPEAAFARMENISAKSCRRDRGNGPLCRSHALLSSALWLIDLAA